MALAVASTSSASGNDASSVVVTAPSGIQAGDMLLLLAYTGGTGAMSSTGFTERLNNIYSATNPGQASRFTVFSKYAVTADETTPNYTVNFQSEWGGVVHMFRITGLSDTNPIFDSSVGTIGLSSSGNTDVSVSVDFQRPTNQLHFMTLLAADNSSSLTSAGNDVIFQTITSSDTNPTWTELSNTSFNTGTSSLSYYARAYCAYASSTATSDITGYSFRYVESMSETAGGNYAYFYILEPQSASETNTLVEMNMEVFEQVATGGVAPTNDLVEMDMEVFTQSGTGKSPTQWTNPDKPSTAYTNESK